MKKLQRITSTVGDTGAGVIRPLCVTIDKTADMLSAGRTAVYQLIAEGEIEVIKAGKSTDRGH